MTRQANGLSRSSFPETVTLFNGLRYAFVS